MSNKEHDENIPNKNQEHLQESKKQETKYRNLKKSSDKKDSDNNANHPGKIASQESTKVMTRRLTILGLITHLLLSYYALPHFSSVREKSNYNLRIILLLS